MKKDKKFVKVVAVMLSIVSLVMLCSCGKNSIVGKWRSNEGDDVFYSDVEFFSDGTHITETPGWNGNYSIDGDRLKIQGKLYGDVFTFKLTDGGKRLTLTNNNGYSITYSRMK